MYKTCCGCGAALPPPSRPQSARKWCSESCRVATHERGPDRWTRKNAPPACCAHCGGQFTPTQPRNVFCSKRCGYEHRYGQVRSGRPWAVARRSCADCGCDLGAKIDRSTGPRWCELCRAERLRATNRRKNVKRRGARVGAPYTLAEIGDRDGWRCHLCRRRVDRTLPGTDDRGPTIDHLIPVVAGGRDERANVALAHRRCNVLRRDRGSVQLRLVG